VPGVEAGPAAVVPPRLKADGVLVPGVVVVVLEPGGLKALPPRRVLDGAGDGVEVSVGLGGARLGNRLLPMVSCQAIFYLGSNEYVTCCGRAGRGPCCRCRRGKD
jgi:hypothetical protein